VGGQRRQGDSQRRGNASDRGHRRPNDRFFLSPRRMKKI